MPSRIVREGINSSDRVNALSSLAELFYRRLINVVDDHGRYFGSPATLRTACWPTCPEKVTEKQVFQWLSECLASDNPLLIAYQSGKSTYIQLTDFRQQVRAKSKFPPPPEKPDDGALECEANANHMPSNQVSECEADVHASRISYSEGVFRISDAEAEAPSASPKSDRTDAKGSRLTLTSPSGEMLAYADSLGWERKQTMAVWEEFRDYWIGVVGPKALKANWTATFRNRCRDIQAKVQVGRPGGLFPQIVPDRIARRNEANLLTKLMEY